MLRKKHFLLGGILLLAAAIRFLWLDRIPHSINIDQLYYLLNAKAFALTGKDLSQTITPFDVLRFTPPPQELVQAELPHFLEMLTVGFFPFSLFGAFLPNAILGVATVLLIYLIAKKLWNEQIALISSFIAAVNPWFVFIGRTAYEMIPATCFYLAAFYILLIAKRWKILFALPLFILAFYSYIGTKIILLPIGLVFILYCYFYIHKQNFAKQYATLFIFLTSFVLFFAFQITHANSPSRLSEILTPTSPAIVEQVDVTRKITMANPMTSLFENKFTVFFSHLVSNTLLVFSPSYLFIHGDYFSSLGKYGLFYPVELLFLIIGSGWLFIHKKKLFFLMWILIFIAIIPEVIHYGKNKTNFTPHITLLFPFFILLMGNGCWQLFLFLKAKNHLVPITLLTTIYLFSVASFLHLYFFSMPLQHDFFNFHNRILASYVSLSNKNSEPIIIYSTNAKEQFKEYLFYNNLYTKDNAVAVTKAINEQNYKLQNVQFRSCDQTVKKLDNKTITIIQTTCKMSFEKQHLTIAQLSDSGGMYQIYNATTCKSYPLKSYISHFSINNFDFNKLSEEKFCTTFITRL